MILAVLALVPILGILALGFYVARDIRSGSFRVRATLLRVITLSIDIEPSRVPGKPSGSLEPPGKPKAPDG
jgi:hypothetical protein